MDNLDLVFSKFFKERTENLFDRFVGVYRARVEETNDPLVIGRVRVRIPELHDANVKVEDLPWAVPASPMGGKGSGAWYSLVKGDIVWVMFEKSHPYAPIYIGAADPTRRQFYPLQSIHSQTPLPVNMNGKAINRPDDFDSEFLPADARPMGWGTKDRYGTFMMSSSTGFFPREHAIEPAKIGTDALSEAAFKASQNSPITNDPDVKYFVINTKYGHTLIMNDVGYEWENEFDGDFEADQDFEIKRYKYLQKLFNEQEPRDRDQRRIELRTRYGHKFEMRDVGWFNGRSNEYDESVELSNEKSRDERWMKLRTKSGMLIQAIDKGNNSTSDVFVQQLLSDDRGSDLDNENGEGFAVDGRQIRIVTRHGAKFALDDRGSDKTDALDNETPHGNGVFIKSRRGFAIDINDKDQANRAMLYTPQSKVLDLNDRFNYIMLATDTDDPIAETFTGTVDNEFATTISLTHDPEASSYHLKLDKENQYLSLKTPEGQGLETRDTNAACASFAELVGPDDRGLWMSRNHNRSVWRNKSDTAYTALDDGQNLILIRNNNGKIQIFANGDIDVISNANINMNASQDISLIAQNIKMTSGSTQLLVGATGVSTNAQINALRVEAVSFFGTHEVIQIPAHPAGFAPPGLPGIPMSVTPPVSIDVTPRKPLPSERNCAPNKTDAIPISKDIFRGII